MTPCWAIKVFTRKSWAPGVSKVYTVSQASRDQTSLQLCRQDAPLRWTLSLTIHSKHVGLFVNQKNITARTTLPISQFPQFALFCCLAKAACWLEAHASTKTKVPAVGFAGHPASPFSRSHPGSPSSRSRRSACGSAARHVVRQLRVEALVTQRQGVL